MAKARKKSVGKRRKAAAKPARRSATAKTKRKPPSRKRRRQKPTIADRIASAAQTVAEGIEEGAKLRRKAVPRGGLSNG